MSAKNNYREKGDLTETISEILTTLPILHEDFERISKLVYANFGIKLPEGKKDLVAGRLQKLVKSKGFNSFAAYADYLEKDQTATAIAELINCIATNHTFFYREPDHFQFLLKTALPNIVSQIKQQQLPKDLRIWSAGCATGEEAYMLCMLLYEFFGHDYRDWNAGVLATDISNKALAKAREGIYPEDRLIALPLAYRNKYFIKTPTNEWAINNNIKKEITFRRFNLTTTTYPFRQPFHIIFCRNVMIYFDNQTRLNLIKNLYEFTTPGGYLFIGHSETLETQRDISYHYIKSAIYRKELT